MKAFIAVLAVILLAGMANAATVGVDEKSENFLKEVAKDSLGEVELSQFVLNKTQNADVKALAQHMIDGHNKINADLKDVSERAGISLPTPMTPEQMDMQTKLSKLDGQDFDREFVFFNVKAHKDVINKFEAFIQTANDDVAKTFAQNTLPALKEHLAMSRDAAKPFRGTAMLDDNDEQIQAGFEQREARPVDVNYDRPVYHESYVSSECDTCHETCHDCSFVPDDDIVYENDWRAGTTGFVTGSHDDCTSCEHEMWK